MTIASPARGRAFSIRRDRDDWLVAAIIAAYGAFFLVAVLIPLGAILSRSLRNANGHFVGLDNFAAYFATPALLQSVANSMFVATLTSIIVVLLAFSYAYALTRTCVPFKGFFKLLAIVPLLTPGLLKAIALVYWFGTQGVLKPAMLGHSIYGPIGIVIASALWTFPHAVILISTALLLSDARLYEAADAMRASPYRTFRTVTLPGIRFGLISTAIFVFIRVLTDFGIPKVIGGNYNVLATDIYKEVIGQQNFEMGAVVSVVLLMPAIVAFVLDRKVTGQQLSQFNSRSVPYAPKPSPVRDAAMLIFCLLIAIIILAILGMGQFAAFVKFWPYNLQLTLAHYDFNVEGVGWENFRNSLVIALSVATVGTAITFLGAFVVEKTRRDHTMRQILHACALLPMAIPGLVLGLGYLLFINAPANPLGVFYGTLTLLIVNSLAHYYPVPHLTALTALKQIDREFEAVGASLKVPLARSFLAVTVPVCAPVLFDIWIYLFLNSMTTISSVIFLYAANTKLASIAIVHLDEAGRLASAAAMAMLVVYACVVVRILHFLIAGWVLKRVQRWRIS